MQYKTDRNNISHSGCFRSGYKLTEIAPCKSMDLQGDFCFWDRKEFPLAWVALESKLTEN